MSGKVSMDTMDISEIRKLIGESEGLEFNLEDILNEDKAPLKEPDRPVSYTPPSPAKKLGEPVAPPPSEARPQADSGLLQKEMVLHTRSAMQNEEAPREATKDTERGLPPRVAKASNKSSESKRILGIDTGKLFAKYQNTQGRDEIGSISELDKYDTAALSRLEIEKLAAEDTVMEEEEEIKDPAVRAKQCARRMKSLNKRAMFVLFFVLAAFYLTFAGSVDLTFSLGKTAFYLPIPEIISYTVHPFTYLLCLSSIQIIAMLIAIDVVGIGLYRLFTLRPNEQSLVALSLVASLAHSVSIILFPQWGGYLPYTAVNVLALFFAMLSESNHYQVQLRIHKTASLSASPDAIVRSGDYCSKASIADVKQFLAGMRGENTAQKITRIYASLAVVVGLVLTVLVTVQPGRPQLFLWSFSSIITAATPFGLVFSLSTPFKNTCKKLLVSGVAFADFFGVEKLSKADGVIMTDGDCFPTGAAEVIGLKVMGSYDTETVVSYAASIFKSGKSATAKVFETLLNERYGRPVRAERITHYENGGMGADIGPHSVLIGTASFIMRMGVRVTEGRNVKNAVFIAINSELAGIFAMKYQATSQAYAAMHSLQRLRLKTVLALRDFNLTPAFIESIFDLRRGSTEYPEVTKRIEYSEGIEDENMDICAILSRDSVSSYVDAVTSAKKLHACTMSNLSISICAGSLGMLLMAYLSYSFSPAAASPYNSLLYLSLWSLPVLFYSRNCKK